MDERPDYQIEELCLLLAADYQVFAKLKEREKDLPSIVKTLSMVSYDSDIPIMSPEDDEIEYVYVVMSGFISVYTQQNLSCESKL